ncbi:site-specific integrase [uncultured Rhodoblastus sp.]|uniref:tyrosine-type recombinase/integrase n=1 Tax=uncultured Rhodoblastus sp. TaxID=543037 RepID=UPI0025EC913C|nr:site-specific integrase [uncultured Rhodoblastus sp.]
MASKLTARKVETAKPGRHGDGAGLWLVVSPSGAKKWVFRFTFGGKVTEMGLGAGDVLSLATARERATEARQTVAAGKNPIAQRREAKKAEAGKPTFGAVADATIDAQKAGWRNAKHLGQWKMTLGPAYCASIRAKIIDEITTDDLLEILAPIWIEKAETASRLRMRLEAVFDHAGIRPNPAERKAFGKKLPSQKNAKRGHHAALPYPEIEQFTAELRAMPGVGAMALEFAILTAARSGEVRGAKWEEIDVDAKLWVVPGERMKAGRPHRVPLSDRAVEILKDARPLANRSGLIFPGARSEKPLSDMTLTAVLRRMGRGELTAHGFRSTFRDWCGDKTSFPRDVAEAALAHVVRDQTEAAYRRGDALEKRRELMAAWARYCEPKAGDNVVQMTRPSA